MTNQTRLSPVVDAAGNRQIAKSLIDSGQWLWFKPELIPALINRRGGSLEWYTIETGSVRGSPDCRVHLAQRPRVGKCLR